MSDPMGKCRSNYFKVKDRGAFEVWISDFDVELVWNGDQVAFLANADDGCIPNRMGPEDEFNLIGLTDDIHRHLALNEVCVLFHVGSERMRVLWGGAVAIHSAGSTVSVWLNDIYELAQNAFKMTEPPSSAEY